MDEQAKQAASAMASEYDAVICNALDMDRAQVLLIAEDRMSCVFHGDAETIIFDGKPLVTFWPIQTSVGIDGSQRKLVVSRKYIIHDKEGLV